MVFCYHLKALRLDSSAKTSQNAFDALHQSFKEIENFVLQLAALAPNIALVSFNENTSSKMSYVEMLLRGKEYCYVLNFAVRCPIPENQNFWERIQLVSSVYDQFEKLADGFNTRKGVDLFLEAAILEQRKNNDVTNETESKFSKTGFREIERS